MKTFLFRTTAFLLGFILFFLTGEFFFRTFRGDPSRYESPLANIVQKDVSYLFKPNSIIENHSDVDNFQYTAHINSLGYRGKEFLAEKPEGTLRIFAVGDSFIHGVGAQDDETIPARIEQGLRKMFPNVEVINAGIGHSSPITHYVNLRDMHLKYSPDMVLFFLDLTDLYDDWSTERHALRDKNGRIVGFNPLFDYGKRNWWRTFVFHSAFCRYIHDKAVRSFHKMRVLGLKNYLKINREGRRAKAAIAQKQDEDDETVVQYDGLLFMRGRKREALIRKQFERTARYIRMSRDLLKEKGIPMILVMYPHGIYVGPDQWDKGREAWGFERGKVYTDTLAFDLVAEFARNENIPFINTLPDFLSAPPQKYFFDYDGHLTSVGNRIVAKAIVNSSTFQKSFKKMRDSKTPGE